MSKEENNPPLSSSLIDELKTIREALKKVPTKASSDEVPLLDEIFQNQNDDAELCEIPVLADPVMIPDEDNHQLAEQSWIFFEKMLYQWTATMDNPVSALSQELFEGLSSQLGSNWQALFSKQTPQQLQQWTQWLEEKNNKPL